MSVRLALALVLLLPLAAMAQTGAPSMVSPVSAADDAIFRREMQLAAQLRCLVCQNQSIAESNAPLALDLRTQIREQIAAGKTNDEIVDYMKARYGDFVLYRPPLQPTTALLWFGPVLLFVIAGAFAWHVVRRRRQAGTAAASLSEAERVRAAKLLDA